MKKLLMILVCIACTSLIAQNQYTKEVSDDQYMQESYDSTINMQQNNEVGNCCFCDTGYGYCHRFAVELKQGYFYPQDKLLRQMFKFRGSKGGYMVEGDLRWRFWKGFNLELNGSYFSHEGCSLVTSFASTDTTCGCNPSGSCCNACSTTCNTNSCNPCDCNYRAGECIKYRLGTIGLSLKYYFELCRHEWFVPYLGAGVKMFAINIKNGSSYVPACDRRRTAGGVVHGGFLFRFCRHFFADLFVDYLARSYKCCDSCNTCSSACNTGCNPSCTSSAKNCNTCCTTNCTSTCNSCCTSGCNNNSSCLKLGGLFAGVGIGFEF